MLSVLTDCIIIFQKVIWRCTVHRRCTLKIALIITKGSVNFTKEI